MERGLQSWFLPLCVGVMLLGLGVIWACSTAEARVYHQLAQATEHHQILQTDDWIPSRNIPQGNLADAEGQASFYDEISRSLPPVIFLTLLIFVWALWFARARRTEEGY